MQTTFNGMLKIVVATMIFSALSTLARTDERNLPSDPAQLMALLAETSQPGAEHARLVPLEGTWTFTSRFWLDPSQPPMEARGTIQRRWILGGRFLEERTEATDANGQPAFESFGLIGFDKGQQKYTCSWASSTCTSTCTGTGTADPSGTVFTFQTEAFCPLRKELVKGRDELRLESQDKTIAESYQVKDGKETKMMEIIAIRKK
jgi:hypothetical protein